jgi:hypothetical protein
MAAQPFSRISRYRQLIVSIFGWLLFALGLFGCPLSAQAQISVPTTVVSGHPVPDWNNISLSTLPNFSQAGSVAAPQSLVEQAGFDPSMAWQAGDAPVDVLKLGSLNEFGIEQMTLGQIAQLGGVDLEQIALSNYPLITGQSLRNLVDADPTLAGLKLSQVEPISDLIQAKLQRLSMMQSAQPRARLVSMGDLAADDTAPPSFEQLQGSSIGDLANSQQFGNLSLSQVDTNKYSLTSIPDLQSAKVGDLNGWQNSTVSQTPGLGTIELSQFTSSLGALGFIALHDVTYGPKEHRFTPTHRSITGSDKVGFNYQCGQSKGCSYLELNSPIDLGVLGDFIGLHGAQWIKGGESPGGQMVPGGEGVLGALNNGMEPTGRLPYGSSFKVVLTDTIESKGEGDFGLFFRYCHHGVPELGCTPYFIGPVPWFPTHEKDYVIVGMAELAPPSGIQAPPTPQSVQDVLNQYGANNDDSASGCTVDASKLDATSKSVISQLPSSEQANAAKYVPSIIKSCTEAGITNSNQLAYVLATAEHESDHFNTMREYDQTPYDACGAGEGLIQVTWCENKSKVFQKLGLPAYGGISDTRLQQTDVASKALCRGMKEGWYTGARLGNCIGSDSANLACARGIVNGDYDKVGAGIDAKYHNMQAALASGNASTASGAGDSSASSSACLTPAGGSPQKIADAIKSRAGESTAGGPDDGNNACAWEVNRILKSTLGHTIGENPNSVPSVQAALEGSQGTRISPSQAQAGDIVVWQDHHMGFCTDNGCNNVISNSSSNASFSWRDSRANVDSYFGVNSTNTIYRPN